jgi:hypothetical protein
MPRAFLAWTSPTGDFSLPERKHKSLFFFFQWVFTRTFKILPTARELLGFYFFLPYPDPAWVNFVNTTQLSSPPAAEPDYASQSFMRLEFSVSAREMVISLFKTIFFGRGAKSAAGEPY